MSRFLCEILCLDWKNRGVYGSIEKNRSKNGRHCEKRCLPLKIWRKKDGTVQAGVYRVHGREPGIKIWRVHSEKRKKILNPKNLGVNIKTLLYQVPGGMLSNLTSQLKEQHAEDKYYDVLEEVPRVRKDLGECPLVTPSSQIVGTQAVFNVLMGERYKMVTKETKDVLAGKYGATVKPFNPEVQKKCIGDTEPITCRYADLLEPELPKLEKEIEQWKQQDEDVLTYALFPQVAVDFFKYREAQQTKVDPAAADKKDGAYPV